MTPSGRAPVIDTLRVASATEVAAPSHGSDSPMPWTPSVLATSAFVVPFTRSTAAPRPGPTTVSAPTVESYWWKTWCRDDRLAEPRSPSRTAPGSMPRSGSRSTGSTGAPGRRRGSLVGGRRGQALVDDRVARQRAGGDPRELVGAGTRATVRVEPAGHDHDVAVGGHPADDRDRDPPARADLADVLPPLRVDGRAHPLLRLGDHHLERLEAGFAARDRIEVDEHPDPGAVGHLGGRARDAAGAEVLETGHESAIDEFQARLDEQLLGERVAHLNGRSLRRIVVA